MGQYSEAVAMLRRALTLFEHTGDRTGQAVAMMTLVLPLSWAGEHAAAVETWVGCIGVLAKAPSDSLLPDPMNFLADATVAGLRSGRFAEVWRAALRLPSGGIPSYTAKAIALDIAHTATEGRAEGYAMVAQFVETLAAPEAAGGTGRDPVALLKAVLGRLIPYLTDPGLLRDIADLLAARLPEATATEQALLRAAALRRERPDDPAALQRVDPDIATAVDRMLGVRFTPAKPPRRRSPRGTARKK